MSDAWNYCDNLNDPRPSKSWYKARLELSRLPVASATPVAVRFPVLIDGPRHSAPAPSLKP